MRDRTTEDTAILLAGTKPALAAMMFLSISDAGYPSTSEHRVLVVNRAT